MALPLSMMTTSSLVASDFFTIMLHVPRTSLLALWPSMQYGSRLHRSDKMEHWAGWRNSISWTVPLSPALGAAQASTGRIGTLREHLRVGDARVDHVYVRAALAGLDRPGAHAACDGLVVAKPVTGLRPPLPNVKLLQQL